MKVRAKHELQQENDRLGAINAELVAAAEGLVKYDRNPAGYPEDHGTKLLRKITAVIAKAKGEA